MKKKKKWKTWLSEQFRKCRENYARIPDFFKKRIVNTLLLSFLLLYGGCALGLTQKSAGFVGWTVYFIFIIWQSQSPMRWWKEP